MYSIHVHARIPNGHPREEKRASGQKSADFVADFVGELNGPHTEVRVGVGVRVGPVEFKLKRTSINTDGLSDAVTMPNKQQPVHEAGR